MFSNDLESQIELSDAILGFTSSYFIRIRKDGRGLSLAVTIARH